MTIRHNKERNSLMNIVGKWFENVAMSKIYNEVKSLAELFHIFNIVINL